MNTPTMAKPMPLKLSFSAPMPSQNQPSSPSWSPIRPSPSMPPISTATTTETAVMTRL